MNYDLEEFWGELIEVLFFNVPGIIEENIEK